MDEDVKDPNRSASPGLSLTGDMILELRQDQDPRRLIESARKIRILFSQESPPQVDDVLFNSLALELVQLLKRSKDPVVQFEVGAILGNMCSGTTEQTRVVVNSGALPELVHLMRSSDIKVRMHAVRTLGNIMCDDGQFRELVTAYNFVRALVDLINSTDIDSKVEKELEFLRGAAWVLHIFCRDKEPLIDLEVIEQILPALLSLIVSDDLSVLIKTLLTITSIAEFGPRYSQLVIRSDLVREVARLLSHKEPIIDALARKTLTGLGIPIITLDVKSLFTGCSSE